MNPLRAAHRNGSAMEPTQRFRRQKNWSLDSWHDTSKLSPPQRRSCRIRWKYAGTSSGCFLCSQGQGPMRRLAPLIGVTPGRPLSPGRGRREGKRAHRLFPLPVGRLTMTVLPGGAASTVRTASRCASERYDQFLRARVRDQGPLLRRAYATRLREEGVTSESIT